MVEGGGVAPPSLPRETSEDFCHHTKRLPESKKGKRIEYTFPEIALA